MNETNQTTNYDQFHALGANRDVNEANVKTLLKQIEESGNITEKSPVLVNERMEVIDGQHRIEACRQAGLPVHFRVIEGLNVQDARNMNIHHLNWKIKDWLKTYVAEGNVPYVKMQELVDTYELPIGVLIAYAKGFEAGKMHVDFRNGTMDDFDLDEAKARLDKLTELIELNPAFRASPVTKAMLGIMGSSNYDHERMVAKVRRAGADFRAFRAVVDNVRELENIYNFNNHVRTRLF